MSVNVQLKNCIGTHIIIPFLSPLLSLPPLYLSLSLPFPAFARMTAATGAERGVDAGDPHIQGLRNWEMSKHDQVTQKRCVPTGVRCGEIGRH
jgi:hypothetical protein